VQERVNIHQHARKGVVLLLGRAMPGETGSPVEVARWLTPAQMRRRWMPIVPRIRAEISACWRKQAQQQELELCHRGGACNAAGSTSRKRPSC
jgi:hypothetical protein